MIFGYARVSTKEQNHDAQCDELMARDKTSLDLFWLKDKSLTDLDNLHDPDKLAKEIIENLETGLKCFRKVSAFRKYLDL